MEIVFIVTCDVSANTRQQVRDRCAREMECHLWTGTELDEKAKRHPDIVQEFFQVASCGLDRRENPQQADESGVTSLFGIFRVEENTYAHSCLRLSIINSSQA
jgi:hypothetical protein